MRILHVTRETSGDRRFGIGRSLLPVTDALQARGHVVQYLTQEDLGPRSRAALQPLARWLGRAGGLVFGDVAQGVALAWAERLNIGRVAALMASRQRFDIVHLHDPWMAWAYSRACLLHRPPEARRWGFTEHGFGAYANATCEEGLPCTPKLMRWLRRLEATTARHADFVLCPTASARQQLARDVSLTDAPAHWHAVPHPRPTLALPERQAARQALGLADETLHVLAVGRVNPVKRLDAIVRACVQLRRPLRLTLLAGGGDPAPLQALAADAPGLDLRVLMVDDVAPYLAAADIYVSAALNESFGMANLEAMAASLPAICTAVGGVPEVTGGTVWLVPGADAALPEQLAQALATLTADAPLRQRLAAAAGERASHWPRAAQIGERYEAIYRGLA